MGTAEVITAMTPVLHCAAAWHVLYWIIHSVCIALFPWYRRLSPETAAFYAKKLKLAKGLSEEERCRAASSYFHNFFTTSALASIHGFIMGGLLVPFVWRDSAFLFTAGINSVTDDPAVLLACRIFCGYIANDFVFVLPYALKYRTSDDVLFLVHHVALACTWTSFLTESWGHLFAVPTMLTEMTGPLIFIRWLLNEFKKTSGLPFMLNGVLLVLSWWALRIFGYVLFLGYRLAGLSGELLAPPHAARNLVVLFFHFLGCSLQLHWGYFLTSSAIKIIRGDKMKAAKSKD
jgi:hypothetical protein